MITSTFPIGPAPWICEQCEQWITERDADVGVVLVEKEHAVAYHVYHTRCTPSKKELPTTYWVETRRVGSVEQWVGWLMQLSNEGGMDPHHVVCGIRFWCDGHGLAIPTEFPCDPPTPTRG